MYSNFEEDITQKWKLKLAGFASNQTALLLSLITSGLNAFCSILSIYFIDKTGRKKLAIISVVGFWDPLLLTAIFHQTETTSPLISPTETSRFMVLALVTLQLRTNVDNGIA
ncbi:hypothetical protein RJT34_03833 [Clitoria ternatea]|uniref:Major facilitator superfamily (MFS) profile domain-containing protein n=1 Tax=Clitoria ternatea TaxID=43366 RepID=A0AAN9KNP7_CLITE